MRTIFLGKEYVALSLIKSKSYYYGESFMILSELNRFCYFLQQEFNNLNMNIVITSGTLNEDDFDVMGEVIMMSNNCYLNLDLLPKDAFRILYDSNLIVNFLKQMEKEKLEALEIKKELAVKLCKKR